MMRQSNSAFSRQSWILMLLIVLSTGVLFGCAGIKINRPDGFADETGERYLAVSPEGVRFQVKQIQNYPLKPLSFWKDVVKNQLSYQGYVLSKEAEFTSKGIPGYYLEWLANFNGQTWIYMTAMLVQGDAILLAEAAAESGMYKLHREAMLASLSSISQ